MAEREQHFKIIRVVGGKRQELEISVARARELGISGETGGNPSVAYLFDGLFAWHRTGERTDIRCPRCGYTQREMVLYRRAGCAHCFEVFGRTVERLLRLHQTETAHRGRVPRRLDRYRRVFVEREELLNRLSIAVEAEDFEAAAVLRDQLQVISHDASES